MFKNIILAGIVIAAVLALLVKIKTKMSGEPFRKLLHTIAYLCPVFIMHFAGSWQIAALTLFVIGVIVYPLLVLVEKYPYFAHFFNQRHQGEVKFSMLQLFFGTAAIAAICGGLLGKMYLGECAILMWGPGDAAAALIGRRFGKHKISLPLADKKKSWEGSISFMVLSLIFGSAWLIIFPEMTIFAALLTAFATSIVGAYIELITKGGFDTVTVPFANMITLIILTMI